MPVAEALGFLVQVAHDHGWNLAGEHAAHVAHTSFLAADPSQSVAAAASLADASQSAVQSAATAGSESLESSLDIAGQSAGVVAPGSEGVLTSFVDWVMFVLPPASMGFFTLAHWGDWRTEPQQVLREQEVRYTNGRGIDRRGLDSRTWEHSVTRGTSAASTASGSSSMLSSLPPALAPGAWQRFQ
eukprot:TRINITY_DN93007_c0_g1_i1.p1 TRINITY_DN93007_c0_g1~~TRINITY_DN93007_c0_g1_i1.p1  ORF type:complete len:186 (+),score=19.11 TRINITY_DN93007_c0_g1_i1:80-637(+)